MSREHMLGVLCMELTSTPPTFSWWGTWLNTDNFAFIIFLLDHPLEFNRASMFFFVIYVFAQ